MGRRKYPLYHYLKTLVRYFRPSDQSSAQLTKIFHPLPQIFRPSPQIFRNDRNAPPYSECLRADANNGTELITFVFIAIYQLQHAFHQGFVDPHGDNLLWPLTPFDILVEDLVEDIVVR